MSQPTIGFIGTGIMGAPMAGHLLGAGFSVFVFNRTKARTEPLLAAGATYKESPADAAREADIVISIVSDSPDVESVYLGEQGVCTSLRDGTLCVDMSTIAPETAKHVAAGVRERGGAFLDAPVSGGKTGAEAGSLAIMVGGEAADLDRARPVFDVLGKSVVHCGPVGHGQLAKLCNQILCGLNLLGVCEAIVIAKRAGLDPETLLEAVSKGAAGSWALNNLGPRMIRRDFAPMFMVDLQQKDLRIALRTAAAFKVPLPGTALVSQLMTANQAAGEGAEGTQALIKVLERLAQGSAD
jgi:3-hydroxyisobutyrate dehydrogenase